MNSGPDVFLNYFVLMLLLLQMTYENEVKKKKKSIYKLLLKSKKRKGLTKVTPLPTQYIGLQQNRENALHGNLPAAQSVCHHVCSPLSLMPSLVRLLWDWHQRDVMIRDGQIPKAERSIFPDCASSFSSVRLPFLEGII